MPAFRLVRDSAQPSSFTRQSPVNAIAFENARIRLVGGSRSRSMAERSPRRRADVPGRCWPGWRCVRGCIHAPTLPRDYGRTSSTAARRAFRVPPSRRVGGAARGVGCSADGIGGLAVVHGDAGIGKTRLVNELAELSRRGGARLAVGSPPDLASEALIPWVEVCASLVRQLDALPVAPWVDALAPLVPSLVASVVRSAAPPDRVRTARRCRCPARYRLV